MKTIYTEVLVIGGGATGAGVIADLALRGFQCAIVEKRDLAHGTTGRYHGLLHSGGRYAVKDPKAATECIEENVILRKILPHAIEDTGGFFVVTPWDEDDFGDRFLDGCRETGVPCEEMTIPQMLGEEPHLNPGITRCFRVPDASADSFLATQSVAELARQNGAKILNYHEVKRLIREGNQVQGAICHDLVHDEEVTILADMVVNASGAWAGKIAETADLEVNVTAGKGTMIGASYRIINTVLNRCKMPADGDIIVPAHTVSIIGTTDESVPDPEHFAIEPWEVQLMMQEAEKMVPVWKDLRMLRCWAGVRPLYQETKVADTRDVTRAYTLLDHETRDDVAGFITITGGKWTTYRQMAQVTVDRVCEKLGTERPCTTHEAVTPNPFEHGRGHGRAHHTLGQRLAKTESEKGFGDLICECELVTRADVEHALTDGRAYTIDDIRRDFRVGMGPCQGGFCTVRVAGIWHDVKESTIQQTNVTLRDFLQERWKGLMPILWGPQLKQERLDELIYMSVLNADHLPGEKASRLGPAMYEKGTILHNPDAVT
jgi:glycerol-3-phosphate dehydrogenase